MSTRSCLGENETNLFFVIVIRRRARASCERLNEALRSPLTRPAHIEQTVKRLESVKEFDFADTGAAAFNGRDIEKIQLFDFSLAERVGIQQKLYRIRAAAECNMAQPLLDFFKIRNITSFLINS